MQSQCSSFKGRNFFEYNNKQANVKFGPHISYSITKSFMKERDPNSESKAK